MRILFVSSEVYPFSKTGGLADVAGALPQALVRLGHEVLVISPWYKTLKAEPAPLWIGDVSVPFDGGFTDCGVGTLEKDGVHYAFVGHDDFQRDIYGYADDSKRFAKFTRAIPQVAQRLDFLPDIVHANDWHTGYLPMLLEHGWFMPEGFAGLPSIFTIHNVRYQGHSGIEEALYWLRLPGALGDSFMNYFGGANALQAALGFADRVTTVSPSYTEEIKQPDYGNGLDGTLRHIEHKLSGILNGIDTEAWNPETDDVLPETYSANNVEAKAKSKTELCQQFSLSTDRPLMAVVSRLVDQKGIDLMIHGVSELLSQGWNLFFLGTGAPYLEDAIRQAASNHHRHVGCCIGYEESLAHLVYAASDCLAVPSRFEPCGLTQMIAMRYGSLPIARATGGLKDTIKHSITGFLFEHATTDNLLVASKEAMQAYKDKTRWQAMMMVAMSEDFSWETSAKHYLMLYQEAIDNRYG